MAPLVVLMIWATPLLPLPACSPAGQLTVEPASSVQAGPAAIFRKFVKFDVVPELSERCATVMAVDGSLTPGLSAAMSAAFHVLIVPMKILAIVAGESCRLSTPVRWNETVIGAATVGKYRNGPLYLATSAAATVASVPAKSTMPPWRSVRPLPEPPPP